MASESGSGMEERVFGLKERFAMVRAPWSAQVRRDTDMRQVGGTDGGRIIEIVFNNGFVLYIVYKTWLLGTNDEIA